MIVPAGTVSGNDARSREMAILARCKRVALQCVSHNIPGQMWIAFRWLRGPLGLSPLSMMLRTLSRFVPYQRAIVVLDRRTARRSSRMPPKKGKRARKAPSGVDAERPGDLGVRVGPTGGHMLVPMCRSHFARNLDTEPMIPLQAA